MKPRKRHIMALVAILLSSLYVVSGERADLPFRGEILAGYDEDSVKARCDATDLQPLEGIWFYPDEMMTVVVERYVNPMSEASREYRIVLVSSNDMSLLPGTVIGYCSQTADTNKYRLWIYGEQDGTVLENPQMCVATLNNDETELLIERSEVNMRVRVNFSRFLPKLLRGISVSPAKKEVEVPEGFRKLYPVSTSGTKVRYL